MHEYEDGSAFSVRSRLFISVYEELILIQNQFQAFTELTFMPGRLSLSSTSRLRWQGLGFL